MTPKEAAEALNNSQYREEGSKELFAQMNDVGLVAVFGGSDDLMEFRGAIDDEIGAWDGTTVWVDNKGNLEFEGERGIGTKIDALWCEEEGYSWTYRTDIPHETFEVLEDDDKYCRGIVFSLSDVGGAA